MFKESTEYSLNPVIETPPVLMGAVHCRVIDASVSLVLSELVLTGAFGYPGADYAM